MDILNTLARLRDDIKTWVTNNINNLNTKIDNKLDSGALPGAIANKVDKVEGKSLSTNDFTDSYKNTLDNLGERNFDDVITSNNALHETVQEFTELVTAIRTQRTSLTSSFTLLASNWVGNASPYSQEVTIAGVTDSSVVDLQPGIEEIVDMYEYGISLVAVNDDGAVTVYALNGKPTRDYPMQAIVTDINVIAEEVSF